MGDNLKDPVLVTGAARGIGRAIARAFVAQGAPVTLCDLDEETLGTATATLADQGAQVLACPLDVRDARSFVRVVAESEAAHGPLGTLVNNAGIMPLVPFLEQDDTTIRQQVDVNLLGVIHGMRAALPGMVDRRHGHVVNVASVAGKVGIPGTSVYCATKFGVVGLTESVRLELRNRGVHFSYVMPGFVQTELIAGTSPPSWPPPVTPDSVAKAVIGAVRKRKVDVYVPSAGRLAEVLAMVLPRPLSTWLGKQMGVLDVFELVDRDIRATYRNRLEAEGHQD